jgi:flagellar motor protein MotB
MRHRARRASFAVAALGPIVVGGCAGNPFRSAGPAGPPSLEPPPGVAVPAHTLPGATLLPPAPSYADVDGRRLEGMLTRSRQEGEVLQDEIAALRDQLASTSAQLAQARASGNPSSPVGEPAAATSGQVSPVVMRSAMADIVVPDLEPRFDGAVVRIDVPADRLFEAGTANLLPGGAALLSQVTTEIERVYPGHFIGIEGHADTEPLVSGSWGTPHQLTTARAAAVFDFLTTRTPLHESRLFLVAHGSNHPLVSNATPAGRAKNRRIELVVYPERAAADPQ